MRRNKWMKGLRAELTDISRLLERDLKRIEKVQKSGIVELDEQAKETLKLTKKAVRELDKIKETIIMSGKKTDILYKRYDFLKKRKQNLKNNGVKASEGVNLKSGEIKEME